MPTTEDVLEIEESIYTVYDEVGNKADIYLLIHTYSKPSSVYDTVSKTFKDPILVTGVANFGVSGESEDREPTLSLAVTLPSKVLRDNGLIDDTTGRTVLCSKDRIRYKGKDYDIGDVVPKAEYGGVHLLYHISCLQIV